MPKIISVQVDDELAILIEHIVEAEAARIGMPVNRSVVVREMLSRAAGDPRPPIERGFIEGYSAATSLVMTHVGGAVKQALQQLNVNDAFQNFGLGIATVRGQRP